MDQRNEMVTIETDRYRIEGAVTLPVEGYRSRLSDYVNRRDQEFFIVQAARMRPLDGDGAEWEAPVVMVGRSHIRVIMPSGA